MTALVTIQTSAGWFSSLGGWNAWNANRLRINVQSAPVILSTITITDPVDIKWTATSNLYVLSGSTATITEFDANGNTNRSLSGIGGAPSGLDVDASGNVYVALTGSNQVWKFVPTENSFEADVSFGNGGCIGLTNGASGTNSGEFDAPFDVAVSPDGQEIVVSDSGNSRIQRFDTNGVFLSSFGANGDADGQFNTPKGLAYDDVGYLYVVDAGNSRTVLALSSLVIGTSGTNGSALGQFSNPVNIGVGRRGIYVADTGNNRIQVFDPTEAGHGLPPTPFNVRLAVSTNLNQPSAVATVNDLLDEKFYVADRGNNRVVLYKLPRDDPEPAWTNMVAAVAAGDIAGASSHFASVSAEKYRQVFLAARATDLASAIDQIGVITPVFIENETAQFYFEQVIDGETIAFPINFIKENGIWKILEF